VADQCPRCIYTMAIRRLIMRIDVVEGCQLCGGSCDIAWRAALRLASR
jgi:hypothetical protein